MTSPDLSSFPIRLEKVFFTRQVVVAVPNYVAPAEKDGSGLLVPINSITIAPVPDRPKTYAVVMHTIFNEEKNPSGPYFLDMECHAIFVGNEDAPDEEIQKAAAITGHSVVFGAIREAVYWMTGRQPYGPMSLGLSILRPAPWGLPKGPDAAP